MPRNTPPSLISYTEIPYNVTTTPRSSASISWNSGDVIVVLTGNEGATLTVPTATGLTFTQQKNSGNTGSICVAGVWTAVPGSSGSATVGGGSAAGKHWGSSIWVWRGSDGVGVSVEQHTATKTVTLTPTDTHSALMWGAFDFGAVAVGTTVLTPTPTNVDESAQETVSSYTVFVGDLDDLALSSAQPLGISGTGAGTGPFTIVGLEILGTTSAGGLVYPPGSRRATTTRRLFVVTRRRLVVPVPAQDSPVTWRQPEDPPLSHARLAALTRGRRTFVVPAQVVVPPRTPGNRAGGRSKVVVRRGRVANIVLTQAAPVVASVPVRITASRKALLALVRGRRTVTPAHHSAPVRMAPKRSRVLSVRLRRQGPVPTQATVISAAYPPPKVGATRRLLSGTQRGRRTLPVPAQVAVPKPVWPNRAPKLRRGFVVRGRRFSLPWPLSLLLSPTKPPTDLVLDAYIGDVALDAYTVDMALDAQTSDLLVDAYLADVTLDAFLSNVGLDAQQSDVVLDSNQTNLTLND